MPEKSESCQMLIRLWDMSKQVWDTHRVEVPGKPRAGPGDAYLIVDGMQVKPDEEGNFIREDYTDLELDAVHAFASARLTIDLWEKALGHKIRWAWWWGIWRPRLHIDLYDPLTSASYRKEERAIKFGTYGPDQRLTRRSLDIVSHETTHAIVHALQHKSILPKAIDHNRLEALCDITPMVLQMSIPSVMQKALDDTNNDLSQPNFISEFAEGYGMNPLEGARSAVHFYPYEGSASKDHVIWLQNIFEQLIIIRKSKKPIRDWHSQFSQVMNSCFNKPYQ